MSPSPPPPPTFTAAQPGQAVRVLTPASQSPIPPPIRTPPEARPPVRSFRVTPVNSRDDPWPFDLAPPVGDPTPVRQAAEAIASRLAFDGLAVTAARAIEILGPARFLNPDPGSITLLKAAGLPTDLLACFAPEGYDEPHALLRFIAGRLHAGDTVESLHADLEALPFRSRATDPRFRVATESGEHAVALIRLQQTRADHWGGIGAGGNTDITRQLITLFPDASFVITIEDKHLAPFLELARSWPLTRPAQLTVIPEPLTISQWAQDNAKPGFLEPIPNAQDAPPSPPTALVPRYASRGEDGATFLPGETRLLTSLPAAGLTLIYSPLHFQGGNLLPVHDPASGERTLLIGEAELGRNAALGLTHGQILDAFRTEFGVDRCIVLPAASFHIDFEVSVRAHRDGAGRGLVAFVNDQPAAVGLILRCGLQALRAGGGGRFNAKLARTALDHLAAGRAEHLLSLVGPALFRNTVKGAPPGHFPESLTACMSDGPADSGVGNFQQFLVGLDILTSTTHHASAPSLDPHTRAYYASFRRREADRAALRATLAGLGWRVVPVPGLGDGSRGLTYLNGIHDPARYIMPAHGGLFAPLDAAAVAIFERELAPSAAVVPVLSAESQRRNGGVHCSVSAHPSL